MKAISIFILLLFVASCKQKPKQNLITNDYDRILVKYSDSSYNKPIDSLYIKGNDTMYFTERFPLQGFFKIKELGGAYSVGNLGGGKKIGKWEFYQNYADKWMKCEEHNYNNEGRLDGEFIIYNKNTQKSLSVCQYSNGEKAGIQREFYPSEKLHIQYETDIQGNFINTYVVYTPEGTELYKVDFGKEGTGYLKFHDKDNYIEWEGNFVNKKKQGWHRDYIIDYSSDREKLIERKFYKNDSLISHTHILLPEEEFKVSGNKVDSITYRWLADNKTEVFYYHKGNIVKKEIE